jgi:hypothetical protein
VSFVHAAFLDEPTRRLREKEDEREDNKGGSTLKCNDWSPLSGIISVEEESESNPLSASKTDGTHGTLNHDKLTPTMWLGTLRLPSWNCGNVDTKAETRDNTTSNKCAKVVCSSLKNTPLGQIRLEL